MRPNPSRTDEQRAADAARARRRRASNPASAQLMREASRRYRRKHPSGKKPYPQKVNTAHVRVLVELRAGRIHRGPCEVCGSKNVVAHHDDYDKPADVRWLCRVHHAAWHAEHGPGLNRGEFDATG
jgi:hypothetical protein